MPFNNVTNKHKIQNIRKGGLKMNFVFSIKHCSDEDHANGDNNNNINNDHITKVRPNQLQFHDDDGSCLYYR